MHLADLCFTLKAGRRDPAPMSLATPPAALHAFMKLPDSVRNRIYTIALYDHDRGAVFLPRALPRKVTSQTDVNFDEDGSEIGGDLHGDPAAGVRKFDHLPDLVCSEALAAPGSSSTQKVSTFRESMSDMPMADAIAEIPDSDTNDNGDNMLPRGCSSSYTSTYWSSVTVNGGVERELASWNMLPTGRISSSSGSHRSSVDEEVDDGLTYGQDESSCSEYSSEPDAEHEDPKEYEGVVFELKEPSLLLVSKQVRQEVLPLYYGQNGFSFRFQWMEYGRSATRFHEWVDSTVGQQNARFIIRLSFSGRHTIEEGVGFDADIDLRPWSASFDVRVSTSWVIDTAVQALLDMLEENLVYYLYKQAQRTIARQQYRFDVEFIQGLGHVFVQAMNR